MVGWSPCLSFKCGAMFLRVKSFKNNDSTKRDYLFLVATKQANKGQDQTGNTGQDNKQVCFDIHG